MPKGEVTKYTFDQSKIFPGTVRDYWVYVPEAVRPGQAGLRVRQPGRRPVQRPGRLRRADPQEGDAGHDRRLRHARPREGAVATRRSTASTAATSTTASATTTPGSCSTSCCPRSRRRRRRTAGRSGSRRDGNDRSIGGASSGAICAFTAAWERPDAFRRVFSAIGTYVGLRGGNDYPTLIRKIEPKPIRIFLQDGSNDLNIYGGDWWMANQEMERALTLRRLRGRTTPGATAATTASTPREVFPDAMRWLWKDWPAPVKAGAGSPQLQRHPDPRRGLEARRRRLQVHRRPGGQREGRGLLQRRPRQQDVQGRPRRQGERRSSPTRSGATARRSAPTAGSTPSPAAREQIARLRRRRASRP